MVQFLSISFIKKLIVKSDTCIHRHHSCQSEMKLNQNCPSSWLERGQASKEIDASWWVTSKILSMKSVLIKFWDKNDPGTLSFQCPLVTSKFGSPAFLGGDSQRNELFDLGCLNYLTQKFTRTTGAWTRTKDSILLRHDPETSHRCDHLSHWVLFGSWILTHHLHYSYWPKNLINNSPMSCNASPDLCSEIQTMLNISKVEDFEYHFHTRHSCGISWCHGSIIPGPSVLLVRSCRDKPFQQWADGFS